jgi:serine/threonine-protein kinase
VAEQHTTVGIEERFAEVLADHLEAAEAGRTTPGLEEYLLRHPDLEVPLRRFFDNQRAVLPTLVPLRGLVGTGVPSFGKYEVHEEVARGGMGLVLRARDTTLDREVALKVMLRWPSERPDLVRRFVAEAKLLGRLQHPAIVPLHELGELPDGRPYLAMKLIQGRTLAELLPGRPANAVERARLLPLFAQVCRAAGYAHAQGVLHRDLKPANIMVGAFGEVQLMDWGLAKVLRDRPEEPSLPEPSSVSTAEGATQAGSVLGTWPYMAPEQARGAQDELDGRTDVFGLGAILCEMLTGRPPYAGTTAAKVQRQAQSADLTDALARLADCGADAKLVELARRCLAPQPADRPADGQAVAEAVEAYLAGVQERLRRAELARVRARWQLVAAVVVLLLAGAVTAGVVWYRLDRAQRVAQEDQRDADVRAALEDLAAAQQRGDRVGARAFLERAEGRLGEGGGAELRERVRQARQDQETLVRLEAVRWKRLGAFDARLAVTVAPPAYQRIFADYGLDMVAEPPPLEAIRRSAIRDHLVAALDDWAFCSPEGSAWRVRLLRLTRRLDPHPWRDRLRDPAVWGDAAALRRLAETAPVARDAAAVRRTATESRGTLLSPLHLEIFARAIDRSSPAGLGLLRRAVQQHPDDFYLHLALASSLCGAVRSRPTLAQDREEALGHFRAALALRPGNPIALFALGWTLSLQRRPAEAEPLARRLCAEAPADARSYRLLARVLIDQDRVAEAEAVLERGSKKAARRSEALELQATGLLSRLRLREALKACREAVRLDPKESNAWMVLGHCCLKLNRLAEAEKAFRTITTLTPDQSERAEAWSALVLVLLRQGRVRDGAAAARRAGDLDPERPCSRLALGLACLAEGKDKEAAALLRAASRERSVHAVPAGLALGQALARQGDLAGAVRALRRSRAALPPGLAGQLTAWNAWILEKLVEGVLMEAEQRLPAILAGKAQPRPIFSDHLYVAELCLVQRRPVAAVRFYEEAFAKFPTWLPQTVSPLFEVAQHTRAAQAALRAAAGRGKDVAGLDDKQRRHLREQARRWLAAELAYLERHPARVRLRRNLETWLCHDDFAGVRGAAVEKLPEGERTAWRKLWAEVDERLRQADAK